MKILAIRGKNLASLEGEFAVDFREEPLKSAGLFAITGPTGSGKTTILDAMCIAFYSKAPRLDNVKSKKDSNDKNRYIVENSVKTFLRRGANDGYAEVDFTAIDGCEYRTRWSISRKRKGSKAEYHDPSYDLTNLTTGEHCSYSAAEHGDRILKLVGLSYQQFTRAVLLAQGNFAAFLKADEGEKGTILQTLTGTDIYSRISEIIFAKRKKAKEELDFIENKRNSLEILSPEELASLKEKRNILVGRQSELSKDIQKLVAKNSWLERQKRLVEQLEIAEKELLLANEAYKNAFPQIERLQKIDSLQGVRDTYVSLSNSKIACKNMLESITDIKERLKVQSAELEKSTEVVIMASAEQEKANNEWLAMKPKVAQATGLEEQLLLEEVGFKKLADETSLLKREVTEREKEHEKAVREIAELQKGIEATEEWFEKNRRFEQAVPFIPSIIQNLKQAKNDRELIKQKEEQHKNAEKLLENDIIRLEETKKREEKLNATLSNEIVALRKKLVEGEPCPVCGSRHHEVVRIELDTLAQEEIEKEKENIREKIAFIENSIERGNKEISALQSAIELHKQSLAGIAERNAEFLKEVEDAEELLANVKAADLLQEISDKWSRYRTLLVEKREEIAIKRTALDAVTARIKEDREKISCNNVLLEKKANCIDALKKEIKAVLGDFSSSKKVQEHYEQLIERCNKAYTDANEKRLETANICTGLKGELSAKEKSFADEERHMQELANRLETSLEERDDNMKREELESLLSIDAASIALLRQKIEHIKDAVSRAGVTKEERERSIIEHGNNADKPSDGEDSTTLQEAIERLNGENKCLIEEIANVGATILKDKENNGLFAGYKAEYEQKMEKFRAWNDLDSKFGSANGEKLMRLVQGYTLDILLNIANRHLKGMIGRYEMARVSEEYLAIEVIDLDMLSERRSVNSLSGGETFIVSLALALALSSVSSNKMNIESLFIDEGFGALDNDTLKTIMGALERLQSQGRKIGVISHLSSMLEQIPVKIVLEKKNSGKSQVKIEG